MPPRVRAHFRAPIVYTLRGAFYNKKVKNMALVPTDKREDRL